MERVTDTSTSTEAEIETDLLLFKRQHRREKWPRLQLATWFQMVLSPTSTTKTNSNLCPYTPSLPVKRSSFSAFPVPSPPLAGNPPSLFTAIQIIWQKQVWVFDLFYYFFKKKKKVDSEFKRSFPGCFFFLVLDKKKIYNSLFKYHHSSIITSITYFSSLKISKNYLPLFGTFNPVMDFNYKNPNCLT